MFSTIVRLVGMKLRRGPIETTLAEDGLMRDLLAVFILRGQDIPDHRALLAVIRGAECRLKCAV